MQFQLVYGRTVTAPLDAIVPVGDNADHNVDTRDFTENTEESCQLA